MARFVVVYAARNKLPSDYLSIVYDKIQAEIAPEILFEFHTRIEAERQCYHLNVIDHAANKLWATLTPADKKILWKNLAKETKAQNGNREEILHHYFFVHWLPKLRPNDKLYLVLERDGTKQENRGLQENWRNGRDGKDGKAKSRNGHC